MKNTTIASASAFALFALPLISSAATITERVGTFITFINGVLVPLLFALAFLIFIWGVFKYFILGGSNEEKRNEGKSFILYGLIGFVVMVSVWGIVNVMVTSLSLDNGTQPKLPLFEQK